LPGVETRGTRILRLLAPIAPHITQHLWQHLNFGDNIIDAPWPKVICDALKTTQIELMVQINGKLKGKITVASGADDATVQATAMGDPKIQKALADSELKRCIVVPGRLVNLVI